MKKFFHRALWFPPLLGLPFFAGGCGGDGSTLSSLRENPTLKNAARAVLLGKSYDRAAIATRNNDEAALQAEIKELEKIDPLAAAEQLVMGGIELDGRAMRVEDDAQKQQLEAQAEERYRRALRIAPEFPSRDAQLLNALGYFLADRGKSKIDFQKAEKFTRAALKVVDESIAEAKDAPMSGPLLAQHRFNRAQGPQDSLAWALFKQGRLQEARKEQLAVLKEAAKYAPQVKATVAGDLYFHLAEIERALKNIDAARKLYETALKVEPSHAASLKGLLSLPPSTSSPSAPKPPSRSTPSPVFPMPDTPLPESPPSPDVTIPKSGALTARAPSPLIARTL